jgi:hypothetical protein
MESKRESTANFSEIPHRKKFTRGLERNREWTAQKREKQRMLAKTDTKNTNLSPLLQFHQSTSKNCEQNHAKTSTIVEFRRISANSSVLMKASPTIADE